MFSKETDRKIKRTMIFGAVWMSLILLTGFFAYRSYYRNIGYMPEQLIEFSHKQHYDKYEIKCIYCHYNVENSEHSSLPTTSDCMVCHVALKTESELMTLVNKSYDQGIPIPWTRVYSLPDYVKFNHSRHIRAQIDCSSCHGDVEKMEKVYQIRALSMKWCIECHKNPVDNIVIARQISGILETKDFDELKLKMMLAKMQPSVEPFYGRYLPSVIKPVIGNLPEPIVPGYGPVNCSTCHY